MKIECNDSVYYPLGGASYVFKEDLLKYIYSKLTKKRLKISIGSQPNSSPHFGTISVFILAFSLAKELTECYPDIECSILFEVVDTAPGEQIEKNGIFYQKNLKNTGKLDKYMPQFLEILKYLKSKTNINYEIRYQKDFNSQKEVIPIVQQIINEREKIVKFLDPKYEKLRTRISCPKCGLADKNSINNIYEKNKITCVCPEHGEFTVEIDKNPELLEYNTPLRNLVRGMVYGNINTNDEVDYEILRITGNDYAGFYQEELLYKIAGILNYPIQKLPMIIYCPLITDWSGAKLSKSLYVKKGAYRDLPKYLLNYENLVEVKGIKGMEKLYDIISEWVKEPYKLFRDYSIYYFMKRFEEDEK